ncbi:MAG: hypothetical protein C0410_08895 [Anaerolinea sp.]|nr:hypothetical protein [Anaerolinea sp.]
MNPYRFFAILLIICIIITGCGTITNLSPTPELSVTVCASNCDFQSIQEAIDAQSTIPGSIIKIKDPVLTESGIQISKNITILGMGAKKTIIQGHENPEEGTQRIFNIPINNNVSLVGMTIRHGNPKTPPLTGGGIMNLGTLVLEDVIVTENYGSAGGGIYNEGTLTIINSSISNNGSIGGGEKYMECETGGGIKIITGKVTLINSVINNNFARGKGGGVHVACQGTLILQNSTVSGNYTHESGGGIYINGIGEFINSTISENSASNVGGVVVDGSGEKNLVRGQLTLTNTLISNNIGRLEGFGIADCNMNEHGSLVLNGSNWIGDGTCAVVMSGDPLLGPLQDNGGYTVTHSLLPGSLAIDVISAKDCSLNVDQRGEPRLAPCDIGSFEVQNP